MLLLNKTLLEETGRAQSLNPHSAPTKVALTAPSHYSIVQRLQAQRRANAA